MQSMSTPEFFDQDPEDLGDRTGDFEEDDLSTYDSNDEQIVDPAEATAQYAVLLSQILEHQSQDIICYLEWEGSDTMYCGAEIVYPTDSREHIEELLNQRKPHEWNDMHVRTDWPNMPVHRNGRFKEYPPSDIEHFCRSHRSRTIECLDDILTAVADYPQLANDTVSVAKMVLEKHAEDPSTIATIRTLVFDLLYQGHDLGFIANTFLTNGLTEQRERYDAAFPFAETREAEEIGTCRTRSYYFKRNTKFTPSSIEDIHQLDFLITGENCEMWDNLYCMYLDALRPTTPETIVRRVVIPLYEGMQGTVRIAAHKTLHRLGYRCNGETMEWRRFR